MAIETENPNIEAARQRREELEARLKFLTETGQLNEFGTDSSLEELRRIKQEINEIEDYLK